MRLRNVILLGLIAIFGCKCEDDGPPTTCPENPLVCIAQAPPIYVNVASASHQQAYIGSAVTEPPRIRVTNATGGEAGCTVIFSVYSGGGLLFDGGVALEGSTASVLTTDANGYANVLAWKVGLNPGANEVRVSSPVCLSSIASIITIRSSTFTANALPLDAQALVKVEGDGQSAAAGDTTAVRPRVRLTGQQGLPVANQAILFRVVSGNSTIGGQTSGIVMTDANGYARCPLWRMGPQLAGAEVVEATFAGLPAVQFTVSPHAGAPMSIAAASVPAGDAGAPAQPLPEVLVTDAFANPVADAAVLFEVLAGGGTVAGGTQTSTTTDAAGKAKPLNWILGMTPGLNQLRASVLRNGQPDTGVNGNPVTFDVTTVSGGTIVVQVTVYGFPRAGVAVVVSGAALRTGTTIADGTATFAGLPAGQYTVTITPPSGIFFNPTSQNVSLSVGQTRTVAFDGFGASAGRGKGNSLQVRSLLR